MPTNHPYVKALLNDMERQRQTRMAIGNALLKAGSTEDEGDWEAHFGPAVAQPSAMDIPDLMHKLAAQYGKGAVEDVVGPWPEGHPGSEKAGYDERVDAYGNIPIHPAPTSLEQQSKLLQDYTNLPGAAQHLEMFLPPEVADQLKAHIGARIHQHLQRLIKRPVGNTTYYSNE